MSLPQQFREPFQSTLKPIICMVFEQKIIEPLFNFGFKVLSIINENRDAATMRNVFRISGNVSRKVEHFSKENTLEEPSDIQIVLPHYTVSLTNAQITNRSNTVEPLRHSDSYEVVIYVEAVRFILDCVTSVE